MIFKHFMSKWQINILKSMPEISKRIFGLSDAGVRHEFVVHFWAHEFASEILFMTKHWADFAFVLLCMLCMSSGWFRFYKSKAETFKSNIVVETFSTLHEKKPLIWGCVFCIWKRNNAIWNVVFELLQIFMLVCFQCLFCI